LRFCCGLAASIYSPSPFRFRVSIFKTRHHPNPQRFPRRHDRGPPARRAPTACHQGRPSRHLEHHGKIGNINIPGAFPASNPTPKKHPYYRLWHDRLFEALFLPDQVPMVAETHQRLTANSKSSHDAMTGKTKAIVGYARGSISLTSGHQPATRELESKYMEEWCVQRPYIYNWRQLPKS